MAAPVLALGGRDPPPSMMLRAIAALDESESSDARRLMAGLRSHSLEEQHAAALALHDFLETDTQEMTPQEVEGFLAETFRGLEQLLASAETHHLTGAVVAIDALMEVEAEDATSVRGDRSWLPRFAKYLRTALAHEANTVETLHLACDALGHLARAGGSLTTEVVDDEAKRALDVLRDEQAAPRGQRGRGGSSRERTAGEMRALCAALVLRALAENAPTVMYAHVALAFDLLWHVLCAPSAHLRAAAGAALGACLRLVATRVSRQQVQWFNELLARARAALARDNSPHAWHGALLALEALLSCCPSASDASAAASDDFVTACFGVASEAATRHLSHRRDPELSHTALRLLAELARARPDEFAEAQLSECLRLLAETARTAHTRAAAPLRCAAFATQATVLERLGRERLRPHLQRVVLPRLLPPLREALGKGTKSKLYCAEALLSLGALAAVAGTELRPHLAPLLPAVLTLQLSTELTHALRQLGAHVPAVAEQGERRLLDLLSQQLAGMPWARSSSGDVHLPRDDETLSKPEPSPPADLTPPDLLRQLLAEIVGDPSAERGERAAVKAAPEAAPLLALQTLSACAPRRDEREQLASLRFVVAHVAPLLRAPAAPLRREAALCCCTLLAPADAVAPLNGAAGAMVGHMLSLLVGVGVADPDAHIRQAVLQALDWRFWGHLCEGQRLRTVSLALHDESLAVRLTVLPLLGQLSALNPAAILPQLRKLMLVLQCELGADEPLAHPLARRRKEEAAETLTLLVRHAPRLARTYCRPVLDALLPLLRSTPHAATAGSLFLTLAELLHVATSRLDLYAEELLALLVQVRSKQQAASSKY